VRRLIGVYHADGSLTGELRYVVGKLLGRAHCALCDITHGSLREKEAWRECRAALPVPFDTVHLDERSPEIRAVTEGRTPCVVAEVDGAMVVVLGAEALDACDGEPGVLVRALETALADAGLTLP
jgi:hypothetical protein